MGKYFDVSLHDPSVSTALELCARNGAHYRYFCHLRCYIGLYHSHHSPQEGTSIKPIIYCIYLPLCGARRSWYSYSSFYFGVPEIMSHMGLNMKNVPGLVFVYAVFTLHIAAYSAEIMRSSIDAVAPGERKPLKALV